MKEDRFVPPAGAFTRTVPIRFSHCDPAGIVYFPHYFDMFNGLVEDWYTEQLGVNYAEPDIGRPARISLRSHRNRFQAAEPDGRTARAHAVADAGWTLVVERRHCGACRRRRAAARPPGDRDDVIGDAPVGGIAQGAAGKIRDLYAGHGTGIGIAWTKRRLPASCRQAPHCAGFTQIALDIVLDLAHAPFGDGAGRTGADKSDRPRVSIATSVIAEHGSGPAGHRGFARTRAVIEVTPF